MATLPIAPVVLPADLVGETNGKLSNNLLVQVGPSGLLHHIAARAWVALVAAAGEVGLPLTYTFGGTYRSYSSQEWLFRSRYTPGGSCGGCKMWNGVSWCKFPDPITKKCPATAAVPGTSNHGLGIALDTAFDTDPTDGLGPDDAAAITGHPQWPWFLANAPRFGFSWELQSEPWHIRYVAGDAIPQAVLDYEAGLRPQPDPDPVPPSIVPPEGAPDMFIVIVTNAPGSAVAETWLLCDGTQLSHIRDGYFANLLGRVPNVSQVRPKSADETAGLIKSCRTVTSCPPEWTGSQWETLWNTSKG